jgi:hypothetical protein
VPKPHVTRRKNQGKDENENEQPEGGGKWMEPHKDTIIEEDEN